ncbi:hypothetical protein NA57DRAFT_51606 [Rhizodiscina lignyota]|uniref:magnesium chelatase n=1 Tax=Rhizodiscina lignyota TaxID=1504668 RepID=A0A9P4ISY6_9PEZI|nr:hypothetical protein NA57DRAFT_51606 [Rhizodiscina lignyota]
MEDAEEENLDKVQDLSDLELAALLCLVADEHCIIATDDNLLNDLEQELRISCSETFGLSCTVLECSASTTLDDFADGILLDHEYSSYFPKDIASDDVPEPGSFSAIIRTPKQRPSRAPGAFSPLHSRNIAEVVIAKNLDQAQHHVQIQALELLRGRRIFTRTAIHTAPKRFLFIALLPASGASNLTSLLNDHFFISHYHTAQDGFPNLEDLGAMFQEDDKASSSMRAGLSRSYSSASSRTSLFTKEDIDELIHSMESVKLSAEVRTYLHNITLFMRLHRAVAGGVSAHATRNFHLLTRALAPLHGVDYVSPSLVALAARKIYPHRIIITRPENERSVQWGSSPEAMHDALEGITVNDIIEDVLEEVEVPV